MMSWNFFDLFFDFEDLPKSFTKFRTCRLRAEFMVSLGVLFNFAYVVDKKYLEMYTICIDIIPRVVQITKEDAINNKRKVPRVLAMSYDHGPIKIK